MNRFKRFIVRTAIACLSSSFLNVRLFGIRGVLFVGLLFGVTLALSGCNSKLYKTLQGETMGTYYRVVCKCTTAVSQNVIDRELRRLNSILSNYETDSDVSSFNRSIEIGEWVAVNDVLIEVVTIAHRVSTLTNGAFDITIGPLVEAWGFGLTEVSAPPNEEQIAKALSLVNFEHLQIDYGGRRLRKRSDIRIDFSAIGKGFGVDYLAELLEQHECSDYLIDIGGEVRVLGRNPSNRYWQVGMENPESKSRIHKKLSLSAGALATSGSYRNFRIFDHRNYSHLIDPRTGYPVSHDTLAVTIYRTTATEADALATALFVMSFDEALNFAEAQDIAVALTRWDSTRKKTVISYSRAMATLLEGVN